MRCVGEFFLVTSKYDFRPHFGFLLGGRFELVISFGLGTHPIRRVLACRPVSCSAPT